MRNIINTFWDRWANFHPLLRFVFLAVGLAGVVWFAGKPAYRASKQWRVERNLNAARKAVEEVRMDAARDLSFTVLQAGDPRIDAYRILEEATASLRDPRHGEIARALLSHPDSSMADQLRGFAGIAPALPLGVVGQVWAMLEAEQQTDPRFVVLFADRLLTEKRLSEAAGLLASVTPEQRTPEVNQQLARVLIRSGEGEALREAQRMAVAGFLAGDDPENWLSVLEEVPAESLQPKGLEPVREVLEETGGARAALMLARFDYAANPARRSAILDAAINQWLASDAGAVAHFLSDLGLQRMMLEKIPVEKAAGDKEVLEPLLLAAEDSRDLETAMLLLDAQGGALTRSIELGHRAVVAHFAGNPPEMVRQWSGAMGESQSTPAGLMDLYRLAMTANMTAQADEAMIAAIRLGHGPLPLYSDLKPLLTRLGEAGRENLLLEICATYLSLESHNPVLLTQYAYLACLSDLAPAATLVKALQPLAKAFPREAPILFVTALAHLSNDEPAEAAAVLEPLEVNPAALNLPNRAIFLLTEVLNGRRAKSDPQLAEFPWKSLQPSERRKFQELLQRAE